MMLVMLIMTAQAFKLTRWNMKHLTMMVPPFKVVAAGLQQPQGNHDTNVLELSWTWAIHDYSSS